VVRRHLQKKITGDNNVVDNGLIDKVIPTLVTDETKNLLTMFPFVLEIKNDDFVVSKKMLFL
jgi:hypothetical protein